LGFASPGGECVAKIHLTGDRAEDIVIASHLARRRHDLPARDQPIVARGCRDIVALEWEARRQHDIGVPRRGGPQAFVHDHGLRPAKRLHQPVEVLVMMKRIAARPVDQTDVR
jgi:hypothetical protein